ncbi:MAG: hypothetical protein ACYC8S_00390 [Minisyncoccota bacterium]
MRIKKEISGVELLVIGLAVLGIGLTCILPERFPPPIDEFDGEIRLVGFLLALGGAFLIVVALIKWTCKWIAERWKDSNVHIGMSSLIEHLADFEDSYALESELSEICLIGKGVIGDNHVDEDILRSRVEKCPHLVKKLTTTRGERTQTMGYYIVYPLTVKGVARIDKKKIQSGKMLVDSDIVGTFRAAKAVYISMVFGKGLMSQGAALFHLKKDLKHLREMSSSIQKLYARLSTRDGLRLLRKYGFQPIDRDDGIWVFTF